MTEFEGDDLEAVSILQFILPYFFNKNNQTSDFESKLKKGRDKQSGETRLYFVIEMNCLDKNFDLAGGLMNQIISGKKKCYLLLNLLIDPELDDHTIISEAI